MEKGYMFTMDSDEEEYISSEEETPTQRRNRSRTRTQESDEDLTEVVQEQGERIAKHLIHSHGLGIICKKIDLLRDCELRYRKHWQYFKDKAEELIGHTFGYKILEVVNEKDLLILLVDDETICGSVDFLDEDKRMQQIFLFLLLGFLTLKGPPVPEGQVMEFLRKLGMNIETGDSPFGNVKDLLTNKLPAQYYLKRIKDTHTGSGEVTIRYDWGPRSVAEVDKEKLLNEYSSILKKPVRSFVQLEDNNNNAQRQ